MATRLALVLTLLVAPAFAATATTAALSRSDWLPISAFCHATTPIPSAAHDHDLPQRVACSGSPAGYQHGSLWLSGDAHLFQGGRTAPVLMVHSTRFDRLLVGFRHANGVTEWQDVRSGDFGTHWRVGGQMIFAPANFESPLSGIVLRFDRLASTGVLRLRVVEASAAEGQISALSTLTGAGLMLLLIGALYHFAMAVSTRRMFFALQGTWATLMAVWGLVWSQLHLFVFPGMAGTVSSQAGTLIAGLAMMLAALSLSASLEPEQVPRWLRRLSIALALGVGTLAVPLGLLRAGNLDALATVEGVLFLLMVLSIMASMAVAWRRGSAGARTMLGAWSVPLLVMCTSGFFDLGDILWGGGAQMLVILASAWQTVWVALSATRRFAALRLERDRALLAEAAANEQARRDPLTGLANRRGFLETIAPCFDHVAPSGPDDSGEGRVALLLIDIDSFKAINDTYGHDAGDAVLVAIAQRLARWTSPTQSVARLGGEEFALLVTGMGRFALVNFAESIRLGIAACDHRAAQVPIRVTASIGVALAKAGDDFTRLYRAADAALYAAKSAGRDRVVFADDGGEGPPDLLPASRANGTDGVPFFPRREVH
ncbi:diguanylate cyclase [Novosphingobium nitrogenifigens DSM 19370]|uniref:diguanylate cyclase n=1 Tax=Novosphingobium nitrogenifigens DSM 19370 TaxID=983920 RepID=F1Z4Z1_9SPHN|nr:GGDEF domain-containing protein [Novosphingobium nitrogenifigens]EGD59982.1 diguanylate cyclase [Novosphingobium nitrogenifigens DSM 19370]